MSALYPSLSWPSRPRSPRLQALQQLGAGLEHGGQEVAVAVLILAPAGHEGGGQGALVGGGREGLAAMCTVRTCHLLTADGIIRCLMPKISLLAPFFMF